MASKQEKRKKRALKVKKKKIELQQVKPSRKWIYLSIAVLVTLIFVFFSPALNNEFLNFDDNVIITENPLVANDGDFNLAQFFKEKVFSPHYKPLVYLSWNLEYRLFGFDPFYFHLNNILLHIFNVILVFLIAGKITEQRKLQNPFSILVPFFIALIFALHPLKVESVVWATERKDLLFSFFFLWALWFYLKYAIGKKAKKWLLFSSLFFLLSILSKSMGITLIAALFVFDILLKRKISIKLLWEKIPHFIVFLIAFLLFGLFSNFGTYASGLSVGVVNEGFSYYPANFDGLGSFYIRILIINIRLILWLFHFVFPFGLSAIYPKQEILQMLGPSIHLFPFMVLALVFVAVKWFRKKEMLSFGLLFFFVTISPAVAIADEGVGIFLSDRYLYIPSLGLIFLSVFWLADLAGRKKSHWIMTIPMMLIGLTISVNSYSYSQKWKDSDIFWSNVIDKSDKESSAYNGRGKHYSSQKLYNKAISDYNNAIKFDPNNFAAYSNRGKVYFDQQQWDKAISDFGKTISLNDRYYEAFANRGAAYGMKGKYLLGLEDLNKALEIKEDHSNSIKNRGLMWMQLKKYEESIADFELYLELNGNDPDIINTIGVCYQNLARYQKALDSYNKAIRLNPNKGVYYRNRANCFYSLNNKEEAIRDARKAIDLGSKLPNHLIDLING